MVGEKVRETVTARLASISDTFGQTTLSTSFAITHLIGNRSRMLKNVFIHCQKTIGHRVCIFS